MTLVGAVDVSFAHRREGSAMLTSPTPVRASRPDPHSDPRPVTEVFIDLVCADPEWLRAEFDAVIATGWDHPLPTRPRPRRPIRRGPGPRPPTPDPDRRAPRGQSLRLPTWVWTWPRSPPPTASPTQSSRRSAPASGAEHHGRQVIDGR